MRRKSHILLLVVIAAVIVACASIGTPDGGPYDETPPVILSTTPEFGGTNIKSKKIILQFDENIKLDNPMEKVVISPPQINQPEIEGLGKKITITLNDSLKPNTTYTIDFGNAIQDNNEGNPIEDYAFTFSTGEMVDTFQVSGYVVDASNLEPVKGMLVGLYHIDDDQDDIPDSLFNTKEFERVSRSDDDGHFIIKGLNPGLHYRAFALKDMDQDFKFSQKSEMIGFNKTIIQSSAKPDIRTDTIWHDSIYYDSVRYTPYTHFYPDDIVLKVFTENGQSRALLKRERPMLEQFTLYFTAPDTSLPNIKGLNFDADNAFVVEANERKDTLTYWIRDSLIYNLDTLSIALTYNATDTLNQLVEKTDTINLWSKISYAKVQKKKQAEWEEYQKEYIKEYKQEQRRKRAEEEKAEKENNAATGEGKKTEKKKKKDEKDENIVIPPMPEQFIETKISSSTLNPDQNIDFTFKEPIDTAFVDMFHFYITIDSVDYERPFLLRRIAGTNMKYRFYAEWEPDSNYTLLVDTGAIVNIYGQRMAGVKRSIKVKGLDKFSQLTVNLNGADSTAIIQLLNQSGGVVKQQKAIDNKVDFFFIDPGLYYLSMFYDHNGDGVWTTGDYSQQLQAEETFFYPGALDLKAQWEINQTWNPNTTPIYRQKPEKLIKQKSGNKQKRKSKNAEREEKKGNSR